MLDRALQPFLDNGTWFKLRHAFPHPVRMLRALRRRRAPRLAAQPTQRIVVVGLGAAALACLRAFKAAGFAHVTVVAKDALFGGKCVNFGCMPTEFILAHPELSPAEQRTRLDAFTAALRDDLAREFAAMAYGLTVGEAVGVRRTTLLLRDGSSVPFDRLVVATGSTYPLPRRMAADVCPTVSVQDFWQLPAGSRLAIYAENNIAALSLGHVARRMGLLPTVLLAGRNPAAQLPSYKYFVRRLTAGGVAVIQDARLIKVDGSAIAYESARATHSLAYDHLLIASRPAPRFLDIDGATPSIYDVDLASASLPSRPDIVFLGDGAGYFTASEAENQARMVARFWLHGQPVDLAGLACVPLSLDGPAPLAMRGTPWMFAKSDWAEIDFRALGWSKVHAQDGKLWYVLDQSTGRITAIHICHDNAKELIALAGLLMDHPVDDDRWKLNTIHPTGAEIFGVVADHARSLLGAVRSAPAPGGDAAAVFYLPEMADMTPAGALPAWLSADNAVAALASSQPRRHLAACFAVANLAQITGQPAAIRPVTDRNGAWSIAIDGAVLLEELAPQLCTIEQGGRRVSVRY